MPADFLLPLFAVTLLANALLVAAAIRGMRRDRAGADRPLDVRRPPAPPVRTLRGPDRPTTHELARAIRARPEVVDTPPTALDRPEESAAVASPEPASVAPAEAPPVAPSPVEPAPVAPARVDLLATAAALDPTAAEPGFAPKRRRTSKAPPATNGTPPRPRPAERPRGNRRRFSLPPLDDDHEKVSRSIESFLAGAEPSPVEPVAAPADGATTVALVAVSGLPDRRPADPGRVASRGSSAADRRIGDDAAANAVALVERALRAAVRATDVVTITGRGRFTIVLHGTGELAARAYLRRIRATVEPLLESADRRFGLAVTTASVLDDPIEDAVQRAERRLTAALDAARTSTGSGPADAEDEPGSAGGPRAAAD